MGYRGKVVEQGRARDLRAEGWTMPEIAAELGVSKGSVSLWTRDVEFVPRRGRAAPRRRGPNKLQRAKADEIEQLLTEGRERIGQLSEREFLVAGAALYAGEGAKSGGSVSLPNSDPRMIAFFCAWLRHFFEPDESRLRVRLYLHAGLDLQAANASWSLLTGIPVHQFHEPYRAVPDPSIRRSKHPLGCATVSYSCSRSQRMVMGLVDALLTSEARSGVAQLAECRPVKPFVVGSSPTPGAFLISSTPEPAGP